MACSNVPPSPDAQASTELKGYLKEVFNLSLNERQDLKKIVLLPDDYCASCVNLSLRNMAARQRQQILFITNSVKLKMDNPSFLFDPGDKLDDLSFLDRRFAVIGVDRGKIKSPVLFTDYKLIDSLIE